MVGIAIFSLIVGGVDGLLMYQLLSSGRQNMGIALAVATIVANQFWFGMRQK